MNPASKDSLRTAAWRLVGLTRNDPGLLELERGRLTFTTDDGRLFDVPREAVHDVTFPWYYFGGGVHLTVNDTRYRLSFLRPNGALSAPSGVGSGGLSAARAWKEILTERR